MRASRAAGHLVIFDAPEITPGTESMLAAAASASMDSVPGVISGASKITRWPAAREARTLACRNLWPSSPAAIGENRTGTAGPTRASGAPLGRSWANRVTPPSRVMRSTMAPMPSR